MNSFLTKPNPKCIAFCLYQHKLSPVLPSVYYSATVKNKYANRTYQKVNSKHLFHGYKKYMSLYKLNNLYLFQDGGSCTLRVNTSKRHTVVTYAINDIDTINEIKYYIIKGGLLYVFFYCSLQWFYYRNLRKDNEKKDK